MKHRHPANRPDVLNFDTLTFSLTGSNAFAHTQLNSTNESTRFSPRLLKQHLENESIAAVISGETVITPTADTALTTGKVALDNIQPTHIKIEQAISSGDPTIGGSAKARIVFWHSSIHPPTDPMSISQTEQHRSLGASLN